MPGNNTGAIAAAGNSGSGGIIEGRLQSAFATVAIRVSNLLLQHPISRDRPTGVTAIAILFFVVAAYLCGIGGLMLAWPGTVSMAAGASLLGGLELAGPFMFLLIAAIAALIGWGLLRLNNWARRAATLAAFAGFVMLIPTVSAAVIDVRWSLVWGGLGIIVRMVVVWYLWQEPVADEFRKKV